jgi:hypothetical protein
MRQKLKTCHGQASRVSLHPLAVGLDDWLVLRLLPLFHVLAIWLYLSIPYMKLGGGRINLVWSSLVVATKPHPFGVVAHAKQIWLADSAASFSPKNPREKSPV